MRDVMNTKVIVMELVLRTGKDSSTTEGQIGQSILNGQILGRVNGELRGVTLATRQVILDVAIGSPSTTWTINHNFNSYNCTVQVYQNISGGGYEWVIPNSITLSDPNNIVITFNSSISGKAVVTFLD
jgi:hypothetical protein